MVGAIIGIAVTLGAAAQSAIGFGFALVAVPILALALQPTYAVALGLLLPIPINAAILLRESRFNPSRSLWRLVVASIVGLPFGVSLAVLIPAALLQAVVGAITLILAWLTETNRSVLEKDTLGADWLAGGITGVISGSTGIGSAFLAIVLLSRDIEPQLRRQMLLFHLLCLNPCSFALLATAASLAVIPPLWSLTVVPAIVLGLVLGGFCHRVLSARTLRWLVLGLAATAGATALARGLWTLCCSTT